MNKKVQKYMERIDKMVKIRETRKDIMDGTKTRPDDAAYQINSDELKALEYVRDVIRESGILHAKLIAILDGSRIKDFDKGGKK